VSIASGDGSNNVFEIGVDGVSLGMWGTPNGSPFIEYAALQLDPVTANKWHGWGAMANGDWVWFGSITATATMNFAVLDFRNKLNTAPGAAIIDIDFFRIITGMP
jgi:hypothetical protein